MFKWFSRWSDARSERHEFQFGELVSFNSEYDCLHLVMPVQPPRTRTETRTRTEGRDPPHRPRTPGRRPG